MAVDSAMVKPQAGCPVRVVLLQDGNLRLQVILPGSHLLDLKQLRALTSRDPTRDFVPLHAADIIKLSRKRELKPLASHPGLFLMPTLIDESVAAAGGFDVGLGDDIILHPEDVPRIIQLLRDADYRATVGACSLPLTALSQAPTDASGDSDAIFNSVRNFTTLRIKQRLEETLEIPPLPQSVRRITELRRNPNATVNELVDIVESDAALAAQVVSWAGSPYYAAPGRVQSVHDAIVRVLGFDVVSNLAVGMILGNTLALPKDSVHGVTPYWLQSVYCSTAVEAIARQIAGSRRPSQGLACLAGLLHNFGDLVLAHIFPPQFSTICRYIEANPGISHVAIDRHLLAVSREQISAWLMQSWHMPAEIVTALRFQHSPEYRGAHCVYPHLIHIVLGLLRELGIGDAPTAPTPLALYQPYGLQPQRVRDAVQRVVDSSEDIRQIADSFQARG